jgi:dTDP-4-dehydrorhamnose reductase
VVGQSGQVASALAGLSAIEPYQIVCAGRPGLDLAKPDTLTHTVDHTNPCMIINAAAYTAVDKAEEEPEQAFAINAEGPERLALLCADRGVPLIHLSTDYVFDGAATRPYREDDPIAPLGVYGASKAAGEDAVRQCHTRHVIIRTAWVYSTTGQNFLRTMLRLGAEREELGIVDDQRGTPTYAVDIAQALSGIATQILERGGSADWGTYHLTNTGETTWYGFAREVFRLSAAGGSAVPRLRPIATEDYPTPARRPACSILDGTKLRDTFGVSMPSWQDGVRRCMEALRPFSSGTM